MLIWTNSSCLVYLSSTETSIFKSRFKRITLFYFLYKLLSVFTLTAPLLEVSCHKLTVHYYIIIMLNILLRIFNNQDIKMKVSLYP